MKSKSDWDQYGADDIIKEFLRDHKSIEFVLMLVPIHKGFRRNLSPENHALTARLYPRLNDLPSWLIPIRELHSKLPQVQDTAQNACYMADWKRTNYKWNESPSFRGGCTVSRNRIKLSARDLLELLAGSLKQEEFEALPFMAGRNPFLNKLKNGQLITAVQIERGENGADDDWAILEFGDPDPAVSPFQVNKSI
jgi:hypothetical protein